MIPLPIRKPPRAGESLIVRRIREALGKLPHVTIWRNNTGMLEDRNGTKVRFGLCEGSADLVGLVTMARPVLGIGGKVMGYADGGFSGVARFLAIEVKQPGKKPTQAQLDFIAHVNAMGGHACWVTSVEDALAEVERARCL